MLALFIPTVLLGCLFTCFVIRMIKANNNPQFYLHENQSKLANAALCAIVSGMFFLFFLFLTIIKFYSK